MHPYVSFVGISPCGVAHIVVCHVYLCVVQHCSSTTFLCGMIAMEEELLHSPRLPHSPTWIVPDTPVREVCFSDEECGLFSDSNVDLLLHLLRLNK